MTPMPLSRLYSMVSTSPLRTVTVWPSASDTSVSQAVAPPARAAASTDCGDPREFRRWRSGKRGHARAAAVMAGSGSGTWQGGARRILSGRRRTLPTAPESPGAVARLNVVGYHSKRCAPIPGRAPPFRQTMPLPDRPSRRRRGDSPVDPTGPVVTAVTEPSAASSRDDADDAPLPRRRPSASATCTRCRTSASAGGPGRPALRAAVEEARLPERLVDAIRAARAITAHERPAPPDAVRRQADARGRPRADPRRGSTPGPTGRDADAAKLHALERLARAPARRAGGARRRWSRRIRRRTRTRLRSLIARRARTSGPARAAATRSGNCGALLRELPE